MTTRRLLGWIAIFGLCLVLCGLGYAYVGWKSLKRRIDAGNALNFPPRTIASTQPGLPFTGEVVLATGSTFKVLGLGDADAKRWWRGHDGALIGDSIRKEFALWQLTLPSPPSHPNHVRQIAFMTEPPAGQTPTTGPTITIQTARQTDDGHALPRRISQEDVLAKHIRRCDHTLFELETGAPEVTIKGELRDGQWVTFARLVPGGGPTRIGPVTLTLGSDPERGWGTAKVEGNWAWPTRFVALTSDGYHAISNTRLGLTSPFGRFQDHVFRAVPAQDVTTVLFQMCGEQRFEIRGLPMNPMTPGDPSTRPATIISEHLRPTLPGVTPLPDDPLPPGLPSERYFAAFASDAVESTSQPTTQPSR